MHTPWHQHTDFENFSYNFFNYVYAILIKPNVITQRNRTLWIDLRQHKRKNHSLCPIILIYRAHYTINNWLPSKLLPLNSNLNPTNFITEQLVKLFSLIPRNGLYCYHSWSQLSCKIYNSCLKLILILRNLKNSLLPDPTIAALYMR